MKYTTLILLLGFFSGACLTPDYNRSSYRENAADVVYRGDLFALQNSIQRGASINERDSFQRKYTPLMVAAREGELEIARWLIERKADVNAVTRDGHTALMYACYNRNTDIVKLLLDSGADPYKKTLQGHTAMSETTREEEKDIRELLIKAGVRK